MRQLGLELHVEQIDALPANLKVALAAGCAQRQAAIYEAFTKDSGKGNLTLYNGALALMWSEAVADRLTKEELKALDDEVMSLVPSQRMTGSYRAGAEFAVLALAYCVGAKSTGQSIDVIHAATQCFDSIDNYLLTPRTRQVDQRHPEFEARLIAHPLMQAEHHRQERDWSDVQDTDAEAIPEIVARIRSRAENDSAIFLPLSSTAG